MISTGSSTKLSLSSSRSSFIGMTRDSPDKHFFILETWKVNVPRVKLSSFSELDDTFTSLQALSNLHNFSVVSWIIFGPVKRIENEAKTVPGTVAVRGGRHVSTRYCSDDGWTNQRVTRSTGVCQSELNRVHEEAMRILRELTKVQDEKRIAKEKEAAELEAKRKSQECLNIEEKSIPQASIRSRKSRIDPTLRNFTKSNQMYSFSTEKTV
ncbi:hypothetical protein Tco_0011950 [Tanacetum coccineum]